MFTVSQFRKVFIKKWRTGKWENYRKISHIKT